MLRASKGEKCLHSGKEFSLPKVRLTTYREHNLSVLNWADGKGPHLKLGKGGISQVLPSSFWSKIKVSSCVQL